MHGASENAALNRSVYARNHLGGLAEAALASSKHKQGPASPRGHALDILRQLLHKAREEKAKQRRAMNRPGFAGGHLV